jgi:hypothetical protein
MIEEFPIDEALETLDLLKQLVALEEGIGETE